MRQRRPSLPNLSFSSQEDDDPDNITNIQLHKEKKNISQLKVKTLRLVSVITGADAANRRKVFYEIQSNADMKIWTVTVHGATITCAKVYNPAILMGRTSENMTQIKNVQRLELEDPEGFLTTLPKSISSDMTKLDSFSMTWARIKGLPVSFYHPRLKSLYLQRNHIKNLNGIEKANNLQILNISYNYISTLPKNFGQLINLTELNLSANSLSELPDSLSLLIKLKFLDCSCNRLNSLPQNIGHLLRLNTLDVSANQLTQFPKSMGNLPELIDLRASSNLLSHLPETFCQLSVLNSLILRKNKFNKVPLELKELMNLQHLNIKDNELVKFDVRVSSLKHLNLDGNQLTSINPTILEMENLQMLSLQDNKISFIPKTIGKLRNLKTLHLSNNEISIIPEEIENLKELKHLNLKHTLIANLPKIISDMKNLTFINLDDCSNIEAYLKIAYKNDGIEGIKSHLKEERILETDENDIDRFENINENIKEDKNLVEKRKLSVTRSNIDTKYPNYSTDFEREKELEFDENKIICIQNIDPSPAFQLNQHIGRNENNLKNTQKIICNVEEKNLCNVEENKNTPLKRNLTVKRSNLKTTFPNHCINHDNSKEKKNIFNPTCDSNDVDENDSNHVVEINHDLQKIDPDSVNKNKTQQNKNKLFDYKSNEDCYVSGSDFLSDQKPLSNSIDCQINNSRSNEQRVLKSPVPKPKSDFKKPPTTFNNSCLKSPHIISSQANPSSFSTPPTLIEENSFDDFKHVPLKNYLERNNQNLFPKALRRNPVLPITDKEPIRSKDPRPPIKPKTKTAALASEQPQFISTPESFAIREKSENGKSVLLKSIDDEKWKNIGKEFMKKYINVPINDAN